MRIWIQLKQCMSRGLLGSNALAKPLGRWRTESCPQQMNYKIDLSNEDHCGPCGQYALGSSILLKKEIPKI